MEAENYIIREHLGKFTVGKLVWRRKHWWSKKRQKFIPDMGPKNVFGYNSIEEAREYAKQIIEPDKYHQI